MFVIGDNYKFKCDIVVPCFEPAGGGESEYANNGFLMRKGGTEVEYLKGITVPKTDGKCKCVSTDPLVFDVDDFESPLFDGDVKIRQHGVVRSLLQSIGRGISDLEVQTIADVSIPWADRNKVPTEDAVLNNLILYLKENVSHPYSGGANGAYGHYNKLQSVLTVVVGRVQAYAAIKLIDAGDVSISFEDNKFKMYYKDTDLLEYLISLRRKFNGKSDATDRFNAASTMMGK